MAIDFSNVPSPCYVLDEGLLRKNLSLIASVSQQSGAEIILAFKGFAMWGAFPIVREYVHGATASSAWEARLAFEEMKCRAHTYAVAYSDADFGEILDCSGHITFNSLAQYEHFYPRVRKYNQPMSVGLRINPEFSGVGTTLYNPCSPGSRLGVVVDALPPVLPDGIEGLHFHTLCESTSDDLEATLKVVEEKFGRYFGQIKWINMGGGHLMTRKGYDTNHLINLLRQFKLRTGLHVILEPGSAFAWETGCLVSTVLDIVENKGTQTAILDVSFTAHMPDCLEMPYKPRVVGAYHEPVAGKPTYRLGGNSCLSGDWIGDWSFDEPLKIGDSVVFEDMIHYTMVKTTTFNGIQHPSIAIWSEKEGLKVLRKLVYEDYKNRLS